MSSETLRERFRQETKGLHSLLDQQTILSVFKGKSTSETDYLQALEALYWPHSHLEKRVEKFCSEHDLGYKYESRCHLLKQDILSLHPSSVVVKTESAIDSSHSLFEVLGYLYVLEGSKLGSQHISAMINKKFTDSQPTSFLDQTDLCSLNLDHFWQFMSNSLSAENQIEEAICSARDAFKFYIDSLGNIGSLKASTCI